MKNDLVLVNDLSGGHVSNLIGHFQNNLFVEKAEDLPSSLLASVSFADEILYLAGDSSLARRHAERGTAGKILKTASLAEAARCAATLFFASTWSVYEGLDNDLSTEELNVSPHLVNMGSKYISELCLKGLFESYGLRSKLVIISNEFGENQNHSRKKLSLLTYLLSAIGQVAKCLPFPSSISIKEIIAAVAFGANLTSLPVVLCDTEASWDDFQDSFERPQPVIKAVFESDVLDKSLGSFQRSRIELGWNTETDVLSEIREYATKLKGSPSG